MEIFKTAFLMVALMLVFIAVGGYVGGEQGMMIAFLIAAGTNIFSYFFRSIFRVIYILYLSVKNILQTI